MASDSGIETIDLAPFKELMLATCGFVFPAGRENNLISGLSKRMESRRISSTAGYHSLLLQDKNELQRLVELLTINETYFLREAEYLKLMVDVLLPEIMAQRGDEPVRIVSAGCSTGEEPYSIAIMLQERFGPESNRLFSICGVDIDSTAIEEAKSGVYGKGSFRGMDDAFFNRYFEASSNAGEYRVKESIRRHVEFDVVNLLGSEYPEVMGQPDIIFYRNVSIYFPSQVQKQIFGRLAGILRDGGYLFVGATETIHHDVGILTLIERGSLFFYQKVPVAMVEERRSVRRTTFGSEQRSAGVPRVLSSRRAADLQTQSHTSQQKRPLQKAAEEKAKQPASPAAETRELFDDALEMARTNRPDDALSALDKLIALDSTFVKAYTLKASILLNNSRYEEAKLLCIEARTHDPLCLEGCLMLGIIARHEGDDEEANKRFREAIYLNASCWLAHFYTAEIVYAKGDRKRAQSGYKAALGILEKGALHEHGREFFPLTFKAEQFIAICRHKLTILKEKE